MKSDWTANKGLDKKLDINGNKHEASRWAKQMGKIKHKNYK